MTFADLPLTAAWRHQDARVGFEVAWFDDWPEFGGGRRVRGHTTGLEDGHTFSVLYEIVVDHAWRTRRARITEVSADGPSATLLSSDGDGHWYLNRSPAPEIEGCLDVDLEASAVTNTLPIHRLALPPGATGDAPAAYVRLGLDLERLEQSYRRHDDDDDPPYRFDYAAPVFDVACELCFDASGLVLDYPGLAVREF